ncbi:zinc-dependent alcohol dehydrogenase family protein [Kluyveromyces lactis]|uniref:KLLA0B00451p n=1 Tax=Kluyveromyces lactis (strain ATCC 8585 / CBS 2359 / DSM 70799 / NBRC 1267 / NRRL Y-1140 / WM37) TaxID=284590 RepID=Q6CWY9_KLULA|nr:uncharacterized protein KLLA0_B00451g [Kluyveromyces lactis]CAH01943.1 KLLA0B00451p [Kluyveromyces lactis]|eukprot:XP_451550.1 uncharacterized protein KLLA0_B00451g [Kluyveromyces lactis]
MFRKAIAIGGISLRRTFASSMIRKANQPGMMKAMVYYGANDLRFEDRAIPKIIDQRDAIIKMTNTSICGTDVGIWKGKSPEIEEIAVKNEGSFNGRVLGHEGTGIVTEVGDAVRNIKKGDKVIISCITRCGTCENCARGMYAHCMNDGGWALGYSIDGTQAEYVRTPFADTSLYALPEGLSDENAVLLSDALPTAHEIGVQMGNVKPGDSVAILGAGPVGMGCVLTSQLYSPSLLIVVDMDDNRLEMAKEMGATHTINSGKEDAVAKILEITNGRGVDCAMEAVGAQPTWDICQQIIKEGGHLANVGVHGKPVDFAIDKLWIKNLTITSGLVNTNTTSMLMKNCCSGKLQSDKLVSHHCNFKDMANNYNIFKHAAKEKALKLLISF